MAIRRPAIPSPESAASMKQWCKHTTDNVSVLANPPLLEVTLLAANMLPVVQNVVTTVEWVAPTTNIGTGLAWTGAYPSRITCTESGQYNIAAQWDWDTAAGGYRQIRVIKNNASIILGSVIPGGAFAFNTCFRRVSLAVGDYIELQVFQSSAGALTTAGTGHFFQIGRA